MSILKTGIAGRIAGNENRAIYIHCFGHALSLAVSDTAKLCETLRYLTRNYIAYNKFSEEA